METKLFCFPLVSQLNSSWLRVILFLHIRYHFVCFFFNYKIYDHSVFLSAFWFWFGSTPDICHISSSLLRMQPYKKFGQYWYVILILFLQPITSIYQYCVYFTTLFDNLWKKQPHCPLHHRFSASLKLPTILCCITIVFTFTAHNKVVKDIDC